MCPPLTRGDAGFLTLSHLTYHHYLLLPVDVVIRYIEVDFTFGLPDYVRLCATKTLGTHDWICKVALSSEIIITIVLGREKMMQLMIWTGYNRIKKILTLIYASVFKDAMLNIARLSS